MRREAIVIFSLVGVLLGSKCQPKVIWNNDDADVALDSGDGDGDGDVDGDADSDGDGDGDGDADVDGDGDPVLPDPIALYVFEGEGEPDFVNDASGVTPIIPLEPDPRSPLGLSFESSGGLRFSEGRLQADSDKSQDLGEALTRSGSFTVIVRCETDDALQGGPARVVTYSSSTSQRAFTLGQAAENFVMRLRTTATNINGTSDPAGEPMYLEVLAFPTAGPTQLSFVWDGDTSTAIAYVDDHLGDQRDHTETSGDPAVLDWDLDAELLAMGDELGSEIDDRRPWNGLIHEVAIFDRALSATEIADWLTYH